MSSCLGSRRAAPLEMKRRPERRREDRVLPWKWGQSASRMRGWPAAGRAAGTTGSEEGTGWFKTWRVGLLSP